MAFSVEEAVTSREAAEYLLSILAALELNPAEALTALTFTVASTLATCSPDPEGGADLFRQQVLRLLAPSPTITH